MRLLVAEDDTTIAEFLAKGLREAGFAVDIASDGLRAFSLASTEPYDAAIIDVMLPGLDGLTLVERLRQRGVDTPVLFLSAKRSVDDRVRGLRAGGDDYLTKPFSFVEVLARIQALLRRANRGYPQAEPTVLRAGDITIDLLRREVRRGDRRIELQPKEFALLEYLVRNAGRIVSPTAILEHVYDYDFDPRTNVVNVLVHRLRNKIDKGFERKRLRTVRGAGYVLDP